MGSEMCIRDSYDAAERMGAGHREDTKFLLKYRSDVERLAKVKRASYGSHCEFMWVSDEEQGRYKLIGGKIKGMGWGANDSSSCRKVKDALGPVNTRDFR